MLGTDSLRVRARPMSHYRPMSDPFEEAHHPVSNDQRKAQCPYCREVLARVPGGKTKCPPCGEFILVRTRPRDGARVVVTKAAADPIERDWNIQKTARKADLPALANDKKLGARAQQ